MSTDKRAAYRARMADRGMVQANEWVPRDQREHLRQFAQALRDGTAMVPSDRLDWLSNSNAQVFVSAVFDQFTAAATPEQLDVILQALIACTTEAQRAVLIIKAFEHCGWSLETDTDTEEDDR